MMRDIEDMNLTIDDLHTILYLLPDLNTRRLTRYLGKLKDRDKPLTTQYVLNLGKSVSESTTEKVNVMKISKRKIKESIRKRLNEARTTYLRSFRKDDYYTFAGANPLPDGSAPMIYEDESGFTVVLSGSDDESNCVISVILDDDSEYVYYTPTDVDPSIEQANSIITGLLEEDYPEMYLEDPESGFEKIL